MAARQPRQSYGTCQSPSGRAYSPRDASSAALQQRRQRPAKSERSRSGSEDEHKSKPKPKPNPKRTEPNEKKQKETNDVAVQTWLLLPAVVVPSFLKAGLSLERFSAVVARMPSSYTVSHAIRLCEKYQSK
jgi:hypothetical protein